MTASSGILQPAIERAFARLHQGREDFKAKLTPHEVGIVTNVSTGIATFSGLPSVGYEEIVTFPGGLLGIAFNVDEEEVGVILLGDYQNLHAGDEVLRTGRVMDVPVGDGLLGRVIDPLGNPLDGKGAVAAEKRLPVERPAPAIMDRAAVSVPLQTGLKAVDALVPIGRGQRELILGDRQTGKSAIAIDTILNQRGQNVVCVYCAIGQRAAAVAKVVANLDKQGAMDYTVVVVVEDNNAPGLVYIHSRMLERSTHLSKERGGGSLTALPIIETEAQDISAYIPTNLISITDGQVYLSPTLFQLGILPAVDVGKSVSRVGGEAQRPAYRAVAGSLKLAYAQFEELEAFAKFGTHLDDATQKTIDHGQRIRACLKQPESHPVSMIEQIIVLLALTAGLLDPLPLDKVSDAERALQKAATDIPADVAGRLTSADKFSEDDRKAILEIAKRALAPLQPVPAAKPATKPAP